MTPHQIIHDWPIITYHKQQDGAFQEGPYISVPLLRELVSSETNIKKVVFVLEF